MNILEINNLTISLKNFILKIKKLHIQEGILFQIKGQNGTGKTILLNTLMGFLNYSGELKISTKDIKGFIHSESLIPYLYPLEYFKFLEQINNKRGYLENCRSLSEQFNLNLNELKYIRDLSEGNKKKVGIISILALESDIMIFDEPYAYLDDHSCNVLDKLLINRNNDSTIIFSSHRETEITNAFYNLSDNE
nr:ATP-binding cassette domain-containing protein [uncultured Chryseobacterium sp.]